MEKPADSSDPGGHTLEAQSLATTEAPAVDPEGNTALPSRTKGPKAPKAKNEKPPKSLADSAKAKGPKIPKPKRENVPKPAPEDPDAMFKVGFLKDVYDERPKDSAGTKEVVTRCTMIFHPPNQKKH